MQEVFSKKINLSKKCQSIYERLAHLNQIKNLNKTDKQQASLPISYKKIALEFKCSTEQIRRYFVELEKIGLIKRFLIPSESTGSMHIQILNEENEMTNTNKKGA